MGTEEDKTNNPVLITIFVIGGAAMIGGSAAIVGMTRVEMESQSYELSGYADLDSVKDLRDAQRKLLRESSLPIDKARDQLIADINRNPRHASWATPEPTEAPTAAAGGAGAVPSASASASTEPVSSDAPGTGGAGAVPSPPPSGELAPGAPAPEATEPPSHGKNEPPGGDAPGHEGHDQGPGGHPQPAPEGTN